MSEFQLDRLGKKVNHYLVQNQSMNQSKLARKIGISEPVMSLVCRGQFDKTNDNGSKLVSDKAIRKIQDFFSTESNTWETSQFKAAYTLFNEAKYDHIQGILDGPKGSGKSHAAEDFLRENSDETFIITCDGDMGVRDFIEEWAKQVGADRKGSRYRVRQNISAKLLGMKNPACFFDEMEETKTHRIYSTIKGVYDHGHMYRHVGMVLIGANEYLNQLITFSERKNPHSFPQMISRFAGNYTRLDTMNRSDCKNVLRRYYGIEDPDLIDRFYHESENDYRRLDRQISAHLRDIKLLTDHGKERAA